MIRPHFAKQRAELKATMPGGGLADARITPNVEVLGVESYVVMLACQRQPV